MFHGAIKEDFRLVAEEFCEDVPENAKVSDLKNLITNSEQFKKNEEFVKNFVSSVVANS